MRVVQMISPENVPGHMGFSPVPNPKLIATYPTDGDAVTISRGLDRDRVVDESGNQTVVFGRRGAHPFSLEDMKTFYRSTTDGEKGHNGPVYRVSDTRHGKDGALVDTMKRTLAPTRKFSIPASAVRDEDEQYLGRLKKRRPPEEMTR